MPRPRLTEPEARERAARASGFPRHALAVGTERPWGYRFETDRAESVFVDATTGVATAADSDDIERLRILDKRGPMGVPPWSPPPGENSWWRSLRNALGLGRKR